MSKERLKILLEEGEKFNYGNFSLKSEHGYPASLKPEYVAWKVNVADALSTFGKSSAVYENFIKNEEFQVLGNGPSGFNSSHSQILGALHSAISKIEYQSSDQSLDKPAEVNNKVFIVHGHDEELKHQLEIFLRELGLEPIVLHRQADEGLTIIEKFEKHSDVGYAFVLLTPDDIGYEIAEENKDESMRKKEKRARQNVIFEFGYFRGKLGRQRICCLYKQDVSLPTDISGVIYKKIVDKVEEAAFSILKDLKASGYKVNY